MMAKKRSAPSIADLVKTLPANVSKVRVFADGSYEVELAPQPPPVGGHHAIPLAPGVPGSTMERDKKRADAVDKKETKKLSDLDSLLLKPPVFDS